MQSNSFFDAMLLCVSFTAFLISLELLAGKHAIYPNISRRIAHVSSGFFALLIYHLFAPIIFMTCCILLLIFIAISYQLTLLKSIHNVKRRTYGELFLPAGIFITFLIAHPRPDVFIPAVLILTIADAAAGIVGDIRAKGRSSRLGSVAFLAVSICILSFYISDPITIVCVAFILTMVESTSSYGTDNLTVPVAAGILLLTLN